jgi:hypothetical protein
MSHTKKNLIAARNQFALEDLIEWASENDLPQEQIDEMEFEVKQAIDSRDAKELANDRDFWVGMRMRANEEPATDEGFECQMQQALSWFKVLKQYGVTFA